MSDTTYRMCDCCGYDEDCIDGLCQSCQEYNQKLLDKIDRLKKQLKEQKANKPCH